MIASFSKWLIGSPNVYFCNDSRLDCTFLGMADDARTRDPGPDAASDSTTTTGRSGRGAATASC